MDVWEHLKETHKPIVMYGTGNGADKILNVFESFSIKVADIFVSNEFYRAQSFRGYTVKSYDDIKLKYEDCIIVLAFAVFRDDMLEVVRNMCDTYEVLVPEVPVFGTDYFSSETLKTYENEVNEIRNLLADDTSKNTFENLLKYRISGKPQYLFDCQTSRYEVFKNVIRLSSSETYMDLGAYRGDTIEEFLDLTGGKYEKIYALEPDIKNFKKLSEYIENTSLNNVFTYNLASYSSKLVLDFSGGGGRNSAIGEGNGVVHTTDVDSLLLGKPVTYVKMDVEGAEAETIKGMRETIKRYKPKLAISAYHKTADLFTLPLLVHELCPDYKVYLRHHPYLPDWETNYYFNV